MMTTCGFLTALECTEFVFGFGRAPPLTSCTGVAYNAPQTTYLVKRRGGLRRERGKGREEG